MIIPTEPIGSIPRQPALPASDDLSTSRATAPATGRGAAQAAAILEGRQ